MPVTKGQNFQDVQESALSRLAQAARTTDETIFSQIDQEFDAPLRLFATFPTPDAKLNIGASETLASDGSGKSVSVQSSTIPSFVASTINFQTGVTTGGIISITFPSTTVGFFRRCVFSLSSGGTLTGTFSAQAATLGAVVNPGTLFPVNEIPIGWVDLVATASTAFKTAGSATSIIENSVSGSARIHRFGSGGSSPAITFTAVGSTPNTAGASATGTVITLQPASSTLPGVLTELAQSIGGPKTFLTTLTVTGAGIALDNGQAINMKSVGGVYRQAVVVDGSDNLGLGGTVDAGIIFYTSLGNQRGRFTTAGDFVLGAGSFAAVGKFNVYSGTAAQMAYLENSDTGSHTIKINQLNGYAGGAINKIAFTQGVSGASENGSVFFDFTPGKLSLAANGTTGFSVDSSGNGTIANNGTISGTTLTISSSTTDAKVRHGASSGRLILDGDLSGGGAGVILYGGTHGSFPQQFISYASSHLFQSTGGATRLTVNSSGDTLVQNRLGVGGVSPTATLHTQISGSEGIHLFDTYRNATSGTNFYLRYARGTSGSPLTVINGDTPSQIIAAGYDGSTYQNNAYMRAVIDNTVSAGVVPMGWAWLTSETSSAGVAERMRLSSAGFLGLGRSPNYIFDSHKADNTVGFVNIGSFNRTKSDSTGEYGLYVETNGGGASGITALLASGTSGHTLSLNNAMSLATSGDVGIGIGTATAAGRLDVRTSTGATIIAGRTSNSGATSEPGYFEMRGPNASGTATTWNQMKSLIRNASAGTEAADLVFGAQINGGLIETMRISSQYGTPAVGLGTSSPSSPLHIISNQNSLSPIVNITGVDTSLNGMLIGITANTSANYAFQVYGNSGANPLIFARADGNVGINNTSPTTKLHIVGNGSTVLLGASTGTSSTFFDCTNTSGRLTMGVESSTGGGILTASAAYAASIGTQTSTDLVFGTSGIGRMWVTSGGNVGVGVTGQAGYAFKTQSTTSDASLNRHHYFVSGAGPAQSYIGTVTTTGVTSTATTIMNVELKAAWVYVLGATSDESKAFTDLIVCSQTLGPSTVTSYTVVGVPGARTYSVSSNNLRVAVAGADTYSVNVYATQMSYRG